MSVLENYLSTVTNKQTFHPWGDVLASFRVVLVSPHTTCGFGHRHTSERINSSGIMFGPPTLILYWFRCVELCVVSSAYCCLYGKLSEPVVFSSCVFISCVEKAYANVSIQHWSSHVTAFGGKKMDCPLQISPPKLEVFDPLRVLTHKGWRTTTGIDDYVCQHNIYTNTVLLKRNPQSRGFPGLSNYYLRATPVIVKWLKTITKTIYSVV